MIITKYEQLSMLNSADKEEIISTLKKNTPQLALMLAKFSVPSLDIDFNLSKNIKVVVNADMLQKINKG